MFKVDRWYFNMRLKPICVDAQSSIIGVHDDADISNTRNWSVVQKWNRGAFLTLIAFKSVSTSKQ
jgi:hypothetical protein